MNVTKVMSSVVLGVGLLAGASVPASAAIVCSGNVCWHAQERYEYPSDAKVVIHDDNWRWGPEERYTFREHEGRGYWRGDSWVEFGGR